MNKRVIYSTILILAGCATNTPTFHQSMNNFVGKSSTALMKEFGPPDQQSTQDGKTILTFRPVNVAIPIPAIGPTPSAIGSPTIQAGSSYQATVNCKVNFVLVNGVVTDWYSQGKACPDH